MPNGGEALRQPEKELRAGYAEDVRRGFSQRPYVLPTKYLYDFKGSLLFEEFAASSSSYYPHIEETIIDRHRDALRTILDAGQVVELGAGACPRLGQLLELGLLTGGTRYCGVDLSASPMVESLAELRLQYGQLDAVACVGDFETWDAGNYADLNEKTLILWLGNTASNTASSQLAATLDRVSRSFQRAPEVLLGIELAGVRPDVEESFPDENGVFTRFRWNALSRLNRTFDGDFDFNNFTLGLRYNYELSQAESFFAARQPHSVLLKGLSLQVDFDKGDDLIVGVTKDYSAASLSAAISFAGWKIQTMLGVEGKTYGLVHLAKSFQADQGVNLHATE